MPSLCFIKFNENPAGIYISGQLLSGKVDLTTDTIKAIKAIYITVRGYANVRWSEDDSDGKTVFYTSHEDYLNSRTDVMNTKDDSRFDLQPGNYQYNFQIQLLHQLPSSYVGQYGEIRYEVVCTVHRPWRFDNVFKQPLCILSIVDLNMNPIYRQPAEQSEIKGFSRICCCGNSGNIFIKEEIPQIGFVPGQTIPVKAFIKSCAQILCHETNIKLVKIVEYRSLTPSSRKKFENIDVTVYKFGPLQKFQERELSCSLDIPAIPPSIFVSCKIIEISYCVEVELKTSGLHRNMQVRLPITIGTIPLFYNATIPQDIIKVQPTNSEGAFVDGQTDIQISSAPPSYEEAVQFGPAYISNVEENKHIKQVKFIPKYPVYSSKIAAGPASSEKQSKITREKTT